MKYPQGIKVGPLIIPTLFQVTKSKQWEKARKNRDRYILHT
jgi:hypothetical protein